MAFYLNDVRFVKATRKDGSFENREIKQYYLDSAADVATLPGRDKIHECSTAMVPATSELYVLMTEGWIKFG